jgi:hypothetical protein
VTIGDGEHVIMLGLGLFSPAFIPMNWRFYLEGVFHGCDAIYTDSLPVHLEKCGP